MVVSGSMRWRGLKAVRWIALAGLLFCGSRDGGARTTVFSLCLSNLRQIDGAKEQLALEKKLPDTAVAEAEALAPYIKGGFPTCPVGGVYVIGSIREEARCSLTQNHRDEIVRVREKRNRWIAIVTVSAGVGFVAVAWLVCGAVVYRRERKEGRTSIPTELQ